MLAQNAPGLPLSPFVKHKLLTLVLRCAPNPPLPPLTDVQPLSLQVSQSPRWLLALGLVTPQIPAQLISLIM